MRNILNQIDKPTLAATRPKKRRKNIVQNKRDCILLPKIGDSIAQEEKQPILFISHCHLSGWYNPTLLPNQALLCVPGDKNIESPHTHVVH